MIANVQTQLFMLQSVHPKRIPINPPLFQRGDTGQYGSVKGKRRLKPVATIQSDGHSDGALATEESHHLSAETLRCAQSDSLDRLTEPYWDTGGIWLLGRTISWQSEVQFWPVGHETGGG